MKSIMMWFKVHRIEIGILCYVYALLGQVIYLFGSIDAKEMDRLLFNLGCIVFWSFALIEQLRKFKLRIIEETITKINDNAAKNVRGAFYAQHKST